MTQHFNDEKNSNSNDYSLEIDKRVLKELADIPNSKRVQFLVSLEMVCKGQKPALECEKLHAAGDGVLELKINGRPAYRCMYIVLRSRRQVVVLHVTAKTSQGQSKSLVETTSARLKSLRRNLGT